jgi:signal transduction histidine kinase
MGIRERLNVVGGHLQVNSAIGNGTELVITIPLEPVEQ